MTRHLQTLTFCVFTNIFGQLRDVLVIYCFTQKNQKMNASFYISKLRKR